MESQEIVKDLINSVESGKNTDAADAFGALIQDKVTSALDARKIELAQNLYNREQEPENVDEPEEDIGN